MSQDLHLFLISFQVPSKKQMIHSGRGEESLQIGGSCQDVDEFCEGHQKSMRSQD